MADTGPWSLAHKDTTHSQDQIKEAAAGWETGAPRGCEEELAGSIKTSSNHVSTTRRLQGRKDNANIKARYRYHVTAFQRLVFIYFREELLGKPRGSLESRLAPSLATLDAVLDTLDILKAIKERNDKDANAYRRDFGWVKTVWDRIVAGLGLSVTEYEALLQEFKKYSIANFDILEEEEEEKADVAESLRALQSDEFPWLSGLKEPLIKLLNIIRGKK